MAVVAIAARRSRRDQARPADQTGAEPAYDVPRRRPSARIEQRVRLGADRDGKLVSLQHDYVNTTSILDDYEENCGEATPHMYRVPNLRVTSGLAKRNIGTPTSMRGPGAVPGLFATE